MENNNTRYVWLNVVTGKFSDSWDEETHQKHKENILAFHEQTKPDSNDWKLIKYECITDEKFSFYSQMKLK